MQRIQVQFPTSIWGSSQLPATPEAIWCSLLTSVGTCTLCTYPHRYGVMHDGVCICDRSVSLRAAWRILWVLEQRYTARSCLKLISELEMAQQLKNLSLSLSNLSRNNLVKERTYFYMLSTHWPLAIALLPSPPSSIPLHTKENVYLGIFLSLR